MADERFDGLFMSAIQQSQGIENFYNNLFSFMRRKTDFFTMEDNSRQIVNDQMERHMLLFREDKKRQAEIQKKKDEEKAKLEGAKKTEASNGTFIEEVDDDEAKKIELQNLLKKQQEAKARAEEKAKEKKAKKETKEEDDEEKEEEENVKQPPNSGNGGQTDKYLWHQTLEEVSVYVPLPDGIKANMLDVKIGINNFKVGLKSKPDEPLVDGKWNKKVNSSECFWSVERDGGKSTLSVTLEKHEDKNWWNCLLQGDIEIDTQKVEPENSKLSDLDGDTRSTVEKMMFDQAQKAKGLPTSEEQEKQDKLKAFMAAHPEMDFSKAKIC
mmetsp:Transcript_4911/g.7353  ORF Transcript_4911/g.7353 Transcript_4911/m.7353 type:complete len:326 (-) Transcript_4911:39-1016(-)|eukprot:CAMPEP_0170492824 /NCGR_PEP_ID=MMETSP0208-20121228/12934_1 /TAXON_ID=197538 /ORGANISM="Strombidium inclinatum, Strain S3" /LENGTH=325 /DNA_ID=CAMNT_0010768641 /DNA_START=14 /DNA_END=991 /DNA_ORIENTATION=+